MVEWLGFTDKPHGFTVQKHAGKYTSRMLEHPETQYLHNASSRLLASSPITAGDNTCAGISKNPTFLGVIGGPSIVRFIGGPFVRNSCIPFDRFCQFGIELS